MKTRRLFAWQAIDSQGGIRHGELLAEEKIRSISICWSKDCSLTNWRRGNGSLHVNGVANQ